MVAVNNNQYQNTDQETTFSITFNNDNYNSNSKPPFRRKKQTTLDQYWSTGRYVSNRKRPCYSEPTVLLNWKICRYFPKLNGKTITSHYIDGDLSSGKGWTTSDIVSLTINTNYLQVVTISKSVYKLYLDNCQSDDWCDRTIKLY